jgi:hypothetical protein
LHQLDFYKKQQARHNSLNSPVVKHILENTKNKFNASKYLNINPNHFNLTKDLPNNYTFLILQHNKSRTELYGAIMDRSRSTAANKQASVKIQGAGITNKTSVVKVNTDPLQLSILQQQWKEWKSSLQNFNLKLELQSNNELVSKHGDVTNNMNGTLKTYMTMNNKAEQVFNNSVSYYLSSDSPVYFYKIISLFR